MPDLDGVGATQQIRALPPPQCDVPIIALTAHAMAGAREQYLAAGMDDYVSKPIDPGLLLSKLADIALAMKPRMPAAVIDPPRAAVTEGADASVQIVPPDTASTAAIDPDRLAALEAIMDPEDVCEFLTLYLDNTGARVASIRDFSARGDLAALGREAHTIIGTAGSVGAMRLSELAAELQTACEAGESDSAGRLAGELCDASTEATAALHAWLGKQGYRAPTMAEATT
jgi:CheY-like chemotaxis protein